MSATAADKDRLAEVVERQWVDLQDSISDGGKPYPIREFKTFVQAVRNYIACTEKDSLVHRKVANELRSGIHLSFTNVINGLTDTLKSSRKQSSRRDSGLECLFFARYDPYF